MPSFKLVWRNLLRRPLRALLTVASLAIAIFLICALRTMITTIAAGVENANPRRLDVMSSSGLFNELPLSYQAKIERVPGVEKTTKFQWFGGYFRSQKHFFAQFAIDPETMFDMYPECKVPPEQIEALRRTRAGCIIGRSLAKKFDWKIGDTIPLIGALHPRPDFKAWEFQVVGIYHSDVPSFDNRTLFFGWDYFEETLKAGGVPPGVGVYAIRATPDANIERVIADVEDQFKDSEQRIDCATEAEFQRQFQTMFGNIPLFLGWIGGGVLIAILVACINTMLMSMREQTADVGVLKSLGFTDGSVFGLFMAQAMFLCLVGGAIGLLVAWSTQRPIAALIEMMFPGYSITPQTFALAAVVSLVLGVLAGILPAVRARRLRCVEALRATD
jgi:putative ABC transport system permease protein